MRSPWVFLVVLLENMSGSMDLLSYEFCPKRQQQQEQQEEEEKEDEEEAQHWNRAATSNSQSD